MHAAADGRASMALWVCALALLLAAALPASHAYPNYWFDGYSTGWAGSVREGLDCSSQPSGCVIGAPHGAPVPNGALTVAVTNAQGTATNTVCPGVAYNLTVSYAAPTLALVTATSGAFSAPSTAGFLGAGAGCPNRVNFGSVNNPFTAREHSVTWTVACAATGTLSLAATAAHPSDLEWQQNSASVTVDTTCKAASCANASPPPVPRTTSPPPSTNNGGGDDDGGDDDHGGGGHGGDDNGTSPSPTPSPSLSPDNIAAADSSPPPPSADTASASPGCTPSTLGYQCSSVHGPTTVHWSINTTAAPDNACTGAASGVGEQPTAIGSGLLHMSVEATVRGYVALSFPRTPGTMNPADAILGFVSGDTSQVRTYYIQSEDLFNSDVSTPGWAYRRGVVRTSAGVTIICFSRRFTEPNAIVSPALRLDAAAPAAGHRRLLQTAPVNSVLGLNYAVHSTSVSLLQHTSQGGFRINVQSGDSTVASGSDRNYWIRVHGILMSVAWAGLLPLGTLFPAHRWVLRDRQLLGSAAWFRMHVGLQLSGMALFIAGFVIAFVKFDDNVTGGDIGEAHKNLGIAVMSAAGLQVVLAYLRPAPDAPKRKLWNFVHHTLGRLTVFAAWATVYLGIYIYHGSIYAADYAPWLAPVAIVMGLIVALDITLRLLACGRDPAVPAHAEGTPSKGNQVLLEHDLGNGSGAGPVNGSNGVKATRV